MTNLATVTYTPRHHLADTSIVIIASDTIDLDTIDRILTRCQVAGSDPLVVVADDPNNLRFISNTELAQAAVLLLARDQWQPHPDKTTLLGDVILDRCRAAGVKAPVMVTSNSPYDDVKLAVTTADDARILVNYLTERFNL